MNTPTDPVAPKASILPPKGAFDPIPLAQPVEVLRLIDEMDNLPLKALLQIVGGMSSPSKMPCYGYSLPAAYCPIGVILAAKNGTVCSKCYALKGRYVFPNVQRAMLRRFAALRDANRWVAAMVLILRRRLWTMKPGSKTDHRYFRWHDSGDLQSVAHLRNIAMVHYLVPGVHGWLPTREYATLREAQADLPPNLTARASAHKVDEQAPSIFRHTSMVLDKASLPDGVSRCPAPTQGNACLDCRACWTAPSIAYHIH